MVYQGSMLHDHTLVSFVPQGHTTCSPHAPCRRCVLALPLSLVGSPTTTREHGNVGGMPMKTWMAGTACTTWRRKNNMHAICGSSNQCSGREGLYGPHMSCAEALYHLPKMLTAVE